MFKDTMKGLLTTTMLIVFGLAAAAMTANEILDRMEVESDRIAEGSMVATMRFDNSYRDGTTAGNLFGMLSKPDYALVYFIEPADVTGTIFLTHEINDGDDSRMWLYLPLLGIPKEMVSDEERGGSFAGSSMSYDDLGGGTERSDFDATLLREEKLVIQGETRQTYVIESAAKPGVDTDTPRTILWIDTEAFFMLRMEAYNDLGNLDTTLEVITLGEFEGFLTYAEMLSTDVLEESSTLISVIERHRPDAEIDDAVFAPESLSAFDPSVWGF